MAKKYKDKTPEQKKRQRQRQSIRKTKLVQEMIKESIQCDECGILYQANSLKKSKTVDHIFPLSKGGANRLFNIQIICHDCNVSKADD